MTWPAHIALLLVALLPWLGFPAPAAGAERTFVRIASSGTTTGFYFVATGLAKVVEKYVPNVRATPEVTGGSQENVRLVAGKRVLLGLTTPDVAFYAFKGGRAFKEPLEGLRAVLAGHTNIQQIMVLEKSPIKSVAELRGRRVSIGQPGSASEVIATIILEAFGLRRGQDYKPEFLTFSEATSALKDGTVDAITLGSALPTPAIIDLTTTHNVRFLPLPAEVGEKIVREHPYYSFGVIKAGTYRGLSQDVPALALGTVLVTHKDADEALVYQMTKAILEHTAEIAEVHPVGKEWTPENAVKGIAIPYHPGAARYLKEKGVLR
jgi:TRAP transporter TAXI family solute receptor